MNDPQALALHDSLRHLLPEMILAVAACVVFLGGALRANRNLWNSVTLFAFVAAIAGLHWTTFLAPPCAEFSQQSIFGVPVIFDSLANLVRFFALVAGVIMVLFSWKEVGARQTADHQACLLVVIAGVGLAGAANDLVTLFLALEMVSIPTYVMLYLPKYDEGSQEASLKYFLLSVFSSALTLFGFSYLYGLTGTTNISGIIRTLSTVHDSHGMPAVAQIAMVMIVAGLGFKITAAPFHFYAPDVYQGTATVSAALLAYVPKLAGFIAIVRVLGFVTMPDVNTGEPQHGTSLSDQIPVLFWFLAALSMFMGNLLALLQDNLKRMFAYSSVAHSGYMLMALASAPYLHDKGGFGVEALLFYLASYGAMSFGAFGVISYLSTPERPIESVDDFAGLGRSHPRIALLMALFLFSLIGIPMTAGFTAKLFVFFGTMSVQTYGVLFPVLALLGAINAAIGGWYYLRIVAVMYLRDSMRPITAKVSVPCLVMLLFCAVLTIGLSVPPGTTWLRNATRSATGGNPVEAPVIAER